MIQRIVAGSLFFLLLPLMAIIYIAIKLEDGDSFIFEQKRVGKNKKPFLLVKIRTMVKGAEKLQKRYRHLNEAKGPAFKIHNDPRYTKVGRFLAHTGLDELPQLINIVKGEMAFIGPRPLPLNEAKKIPNKYEARFNHLPGITSLWVVKGAHELSFKEWMELDLEYVESKSFVLDLKIAFLTCILIIKQILKKLKKYEIYKNKR